MTTEAGVKVSALHTRVNVSYGDRGQDITTAVEPKDGETVSDFARRILRDGFPNHLPDYEAYVTLRIVRPAERTGRIEVDPWGDVNDPI